MNRYSLRALLVSFALLLGLPASASIVTITSSLDLTTAQSNPDPNVAWVSVVNPLAQSVLVSAGDTVRLVYDFLPGQAIRMTGGDQVQSIWVHNWLDLDLSSPEPGIGNFSDISITFQGLTGNLTKPLFKASDSQPGWIIGGVDLKDHYLGKGDTISFTGVTATFAVDSFTEGPLYFNMPSVWFIAWDGAVTPQFATVPEPAGMALFLIGLLILAGMVRSGRRV